jgi:hypothetical protein
VLDHYFDQLQIERVNRGGWLGAHRSATAALSRPCGPMIRLRSPSLTHGVEGSERRAPRSRRRYAQLVICRVAGVKEA